MERDLRGTPLYREVEQYFQDWMGPGFGRITGAADVAPSPDGTTIAFTGSRMEKLEGTPTSRVCLVGADGDGEVREVTNGPNSDRHPKWSPDGRTLAFLSDRAEAGTFQLYLLESGALGEAVATPPVDGTVEYLAWSPDGSRILLGVAGRGADKAGADGSGTTKARAEDLPDWIPTVDEGVGDEDWRRAWVYDVAARAVRPVSREGLNVWEAAWLGNDRLAAIVSDRPTEDAWYWAPLATIDLDSGKESELLHPQSPLHQLALPTPSPDGSTIAVLEAVCSDRAIVAGELLLVPADGGEPRRLTPLGADVTHLSWRGEDRLLVAGERHLESVFGEVDPATGEADELWVSDGSCGYWHPAGEPLGEDGLVTTSDAYDRPPSVVVVRDGVARTVVDLSHPGTDHLRSIGGSIETVTWSAPDGLEIEGFLIRPDGGGRPHATLLWVHGGPIGRTDNMWAMGRGLVPLLVSRGYAVLMPNPRGSSGRGQDFAKMVVGDMGGADAQDLLAGVDAMVERGIADPDRIGVIGGSYGGFMSAWLVTQDQRWAAAVPVAPVTDYYSQHWTSNIGFWDRIFLGEDPQVPGGEYFRRSPVFFARNVRTPVLQTAGGQDRCTPAGQAEEFHRALLEAGHVETELVVYPKEGHGVRTFPATIDFATRVLAWFERHMPARREAS